MSGTVKVQVCATCSNRLAGKKLHSIIPKQDLPVRHGDVLTHREADALRHPDEDTDPFSGRISMLAATGSHRSGAEKRMHSGNRDTRSGQVRGSTLRKIGPLNQ